jgi:L-amino acid N-acyltransferase YncA
LQTIRLANDTDIPSLQALYKACTAYLLEKEIYQWDETYPTLEHITNHVKAGEMYVFVGNEDKIVGAVVLNEWEAPEWQTVDWQGSKPLVIHMLCVLPTAQNVGVGKKLLLFAETTAKEQGYQSLRLDSYAGNSKSLAFYENALFEKVGHVSLTGKKVGCATYICYEKKM